MMDEKKELRRTIRERKRLMTDEEKAERSHEVMQKLGASKEFASAEVVLMYWSMADEVQTHDFVDSIYEEKVVLLPCVDGDDLRLRQYTGRECLKAGEQFGIGEPTGQEWTETDRIDLIVVPGVAFDERGNRMGRGRGFYDRLLKTTPKALKVGVCYGVQMVEQVPSEPHDMAMDMVITEDYTPTATEGGIVR